MKEWWLQTEILSIPAWNWLVMAAVTAVVFVVLITAHRIVKAHLDGDYAHKKYGMAGDVLRRAASRTSYFVLFAFSLFVGLRFLNLSASAQETVSALWFLAAVFQLALWLDAVLISGLRRYADRRENMNGVTLTLLVFFLRTVVWVVAVLSILDNMGVNITAFVASLGIGGVAIALAAQVVLGDLFASISIGLDKPFEQGDFIVVSGIAGSIEHVGLKTTRIRSLGGEQIVCSNQELLKQTIQNYKRMELRRIAFRFIVSYHTGADDAEALSDAVKQLISDIEGTRFDRAHLLQFSDRGLEYEVVYYVLSADYNRYMDIQQRINLGIMRELEGRGLGFGWQEINVHTDAKDRMVHIRGPRAVADSRA